MLKFSGKVNNTTNSISSLVCIAMLCSFTFGNPSISSEKAIQTNTENESQDQKKKQVWIRVSERRHEFFVFTREQQGISGAVAQAQNAEILGSSGTILSVDNKTALLHDGTLLISCRKGNLILGTGSSKIVIPENVIALVEKDSSSKRGSTPEKIAVFSPDQKAIVKLSRKGGKEVIELHNNEVLLFGLKDEGRPEPVSFEKNKNLAFNTSSLSLIAENKTADLKIASTPLIILATDSTMFRCPAPDTIALRSGQIFAEVADKLRVETALAALAAAKGAIIDIEADKESSRIKSFSQSGHVEVHCAEQPIKLSAGQELLIESHAIEEKDIYPADGIGRRRTESVNLKNKLFGSTCDFSMISYLNECDHVLEIKRALDEDMKDLRERILKTASALQTITAHHGNYRATSRALRKRVPRQSSKPSA